MMAQTEESATATAFEWKVESAAAVPLSALSFALHSVISASSALPMMVRVGAGGAGNILPTNFLPILPFACEVLMGKWLIRIN